MGSRSVSSAAASADDHPNAAWVRRCTDRKVPVRLAAKMNTLGLLQLSCVSTDPQLLQSWPLEFDLRPYERDSTPKPGSKASTPGEPNATTEARRAARNHIATIFASPAKSERLTANAILKLLERILLLPRHEWNAALLRTLWPPLNEGTAGRKHSVEHEETWFALAGIPASPGFWLHWRRTAHRRVVADPYCWILLSRQTQQSSGIHPLATSRRRAHAGKAGSAPGKRAGEHPQRERIAGACPTCGLA